MSRCSNSESSVWLPRQVEVYAAMLSRMAIEPDGGWQRSAAVHRLGRLPGGGDRVRPFTGDPDPAVAAAAIAALGHSDRPVDALELLLRLAAGDRAVIAAAAASRTARFVSPEQLGPVLTDALAIEKVTTRKALVDLIAAMRIPDAAGVLAARWQQPRLHRDVRIALVHAARLLLPDPRMWQLLSQAAADPEVAAAVLAGRPQRLAPSLIPDYAALVDRVASAADPDLAVAGLRVLPDWASYRPELTQTMAAAIGDLDRTATWRSATIAIVLTTCVTDDSAALSAAIQSLLDLLPVRLRGRDQPARQRLVSLLDVLGRQARSDGAAAEADTAAASQLLTIDSCRRLAFRLRTTTLRWTEPGLPTGSGR